MIKWRIVVFITAAIVIRALPASCAIDWSQAKEDAAAAEICAPSLPALSTAAQLVDLRTAAYDKYYVAALEHRSTVFAWQASASKFIFVMVMVLVLSGLTFSAVQFYSGMRRGTTNAAEEIELSLQAVKIRSQFLGVITLAMSLAFFYLYVAKVYPIVTVGDTSSGAPNKGTP